MCTFQPFDMKSHISNILLNKIMNVEDVLEGIRLFYCQNKQMLPGVYDLGLCTLNFRKVSAAAA